jgi:uncharacterized protein (TIGR03790 family)
MFVIEFNLPAEQPLADSTIVVYNKAVPESVQFAKFYAEKRGIAPDHLVGLDCSTQEEITREQYDATIAEPLRAVFDNRSNIQQPANRRSRSRPINRSGRLCPQYTQHIREYSQNWLQRFVR